MTPIEKLRKWADCAWDAPDELRLLLAAYDARGEEIEAGRKYEDNRRAMSDGTYQGDSETGYAEQEAFHRKWFAAREATDSAVAAVEGGKA